MSKNTPINPSGGSFSFPSITRGVAMQLSAEAGFVAYASGKTAVVRSIAQNSNPGSGEEALKGWIYKHTSTVTCVRLSPRGNMCLSGDESGSIVIWGLLPDKPIKYQKEGFLGGPIRDAAWSADQERIVICADTRGQSAAAVMVDGGNTIGEIKGHARSISTVAFRPARPFRVFSGGMDTNVAFHEGPPFKFGKGYTQGLTNTVTAVRFNPSGELCACTSSASGVQLLDGKTGDPAGEIKTEHKGSIMSVDWAPAASADQAASAPPRLVTASADKSVQCYAKRDDGSWGKAWETSLGKDVGQMQYGAVYVHGGMRVLAVSLDGTISFLAADTGAVSSQLRGHGRPILSIDEVEGGKGFLTADTAGRVVSWGLDGNSGHIISGGALPDHKVETFNTFIATDAGCLAFGGGKMYKADAKLQSALDKGADSAPVVFTARLTGGDGRTVLVASKQVLLALDTATGAQKATLDIKSLGFGDAACIAGDAATAQVAIAGNLTIVLLKFDGSKFEKVVELKGDASPHRAGVTALAFSPSGKLLASGDSSRTIGVWDIEKRKSLFDDLVYHAGHLNALAFFDDSTLASGAGDGNVIIWNLAEKTRKSATNEPHPGGVQVVSKVGNFIVSGGFGGNVMVWRP